jgi:predicted small integral membrane protein
MAFKVMPSGHLKRGLLIQVDLRACKCHISLRTRCYLHVEMAGLVIKDWYGIMGTAEFRYSTIN